MAKETAALRKHKAKLTSLGMDSDAVFHKSKLLLTVYRDVTWAISEKLEEIRDHAYEVGNHSMDAGFRYLADFAPEVDADKFAERVCCICETRMYIDLIDKALIRMKDYPVYGELYQPFAGYDESSTPFIKTKKYLFYLVASAKPGILFDMRFWQSGGWRDDTVVLFTRILPILDSSFYISRIQLMRLI
ncbi:MAG: hypothetical protein PHE47_05740 [Oscillospiraceae bacterium]|nr:hypothetical protein [Oscillospiraceae bacterium]